MRLQLVVLGSGQDGGSPQLGSHGASTVRTASSVAVVSDEVRLLFDASPDLRTQSALLWDGGAGPLFDGVFVTHLHMGHYAGLVHFGKEAANTDGIPLHASPSVIDALADNEPWASLFRNGNLRPEPMDDTVSFGRVAVSRIPVPHRAEMSDASAFSVSVDGAPWALYLPDIDAWGLWDEARATIGAHDVCIVDATFGADDELPGRDLAAIPHPFVAETLERFGDVASSSTIVLSHINHSNALNDPTSPLTTRVRSAGFVVAEDGMTFDWQG